MPFAHYFSNGTLTIKTSPYGGFWAPNVDALLGRGPHRVHKINTNRDIVTVKFVGLEEADVLQLATELVELKPGIHVIGIDSFVSAKTLSRLPEVKVLDLLRRDASCLFGVVIKAFCLRLESMKNLTSINNDGHFALLTHLHLAHCKDLTSLDLRTMPQMTGLQVNFCEQLATIDTAAANVTLTHGLKDVVINFHATVRYVELNCVWVAQIAMHSKHTADCIFHCRDVTGKCRLVGDGFDGEYRMIRVPDDTAIPYSYYGNEMQDRRWAHARKIVRTAALCMRRKRFLTLSNILYTVFKFLI